jgi:hypothetical protein
MDDQRFDRLARSFAQRTSRRSVLRAAAAGAAAGVLARGATASAQADCEAPLVDCNGTCVDLLTDMANCGACGEICESSLVGVACIGGECVRTSCPAALPLQCGVTVDDCVDPATDPNNCGDCGVVCDSGVCIGGACGACAEGQTTCVGYCADTCCDNNNCGACGVVCTDGRTCFEGICDCPSGDCGCAEGQIECGGVCIDSCCDNNNCGGCGIVCTGGLTCFEGLCDCPSGDCGEPEPTPPLTLPNTGAGSTGTGSDNDWAPAAVVAGLLATGAAALSKLRREATDR